METEKQHKKQDKAPWLEPYRFKKGQSGNPVGRKPGKSLKTFAREYLESLPDDEKVEYLRSLPTEIVWKMAEGNPQNNVDLTTKGEKITPEHQEQANKAIDELLEDKGNTSD